MLSGASDTRPRAGAPGKHREFRAKAHGAHKKRHLFGRHCELEPGRTRALAHTFRVALIRPSAHDSIRVATLRKIRTGGRHTVARVACGSPAPLVRRPHDADPPYLEGLNEEQRRAVESLDGPVLILAGAGVGKTRVLTTRIAHIVSTGRARAHEILAVTFTNKAAREMRQRVAVFSGSEQAMPWLGTFHSVGAKILRMHAELVGLRPNFTILDTDDQLRLLKQLLQAEHLDDKRWPARALANLIDGWKNRGIDPKERPGERGCRFRRRQERGPV